MTRGGHVHGINGSCSGDVVASVAEHRTTTCTAAHAKYTQLTNHGVAHVHVCREADGRVCHRGG